MEFLYKYARIVPFLPLLASAAIGLGSLLFPVATKSLRRIWALISIFMISTAMLLSFNLFLQQITGGPIHRYFWSWIINNNFSLELGYLIDPLTSIMLVLITTVGTMVLIYSDNYMSHDEAYVRFFAYLNFFNASMLGLVISPNLVQIYIFWELVGMCSYLLIGFWFTRPSAADACQKAFITNRAGDFGLLLGILGFYWVTGSFEFNYLSEKLNEFIANDGAGSFFATSCAFLLFLGPVAKSAQFPLHVWLPDAMEGPTPISALIHAATMVAAGIFLVARLFPLFRTLPLIMNIISWIGGITALLGATMALAQKDLKKGLAYSTMSQLGYMMLALGIDSYRAALFHLITHAYSKALLFLGSGSVIHSMEPIVGYCPDKSQNMALMGGLRKYMPITGITFLLGTLSLSGIPPFACFWSKDQILSDSKLYSPILGGITWVTAGLTAFYMFRMYLLTFEGDFNIDLTNSYNDNITLYSTSIWGQESSTFSRTRIDSLSFPFTRTNNFFSKEVFQISEKMEKFYNNKTNFVATYPFFEKGDFAYPKESGHIMLLPLVLLGISTLFVGLIGVPFFRGGVSYDILTQWLTPSMKLFYKNHPENWSEFFTDAIASIGIAFIGILIAYVLYRPINFLLQYVPNRAHPQMKRISDQSINMIYNWSYHRAYIDKYYGIIFTKGIRRLAESSQSFDQWAIDGIPIAVGIIGLFVGEGMRYLGGGRISSYIFGCLFGALISGLIYYFSF
uniref:NAD(P)H-quinone oxidoreductase subunit 5, chloroplastic n=2 Tax=Podocarpus TaxID=3363 RepID=A0A6H0JSQ6_9CONI|nr:NdhF [Podocarpus neriifolius]YP_010355122.1 NADH-plastoquinone oxidoreductase subunit 5 [Podocarpus macrophyllus]WEF49928.1 NADH-plastoquinone oxidoreductase subunit 5 [Podocarpus macrophyllus var. maki]QIU83746.1 NdhF [Podocarpus neriifolius]UOK15681.1 NADH-plastoquinone oxidoreductase subunit 5 [Podocarpus macrophyllus]WDR39322.1 NADH-plastoquinone oxidoreductase subunit 5 [Podocarpus macrophyllus]